MQTSNVSEVVGQLSSRRHRSRGARHESSQPASHVSVFIIMTSPLDSAILPPLHRLYPLPLLLLPLLLHRLYPLLLLPLPLLLPCLPPLQLLPQRVQPRPRQPLLQQPAHGGAPAQLARLLLRNQLAQVLADGIMPGGGAVRGGRWHGVRGVVQGQYGAREVRYGVWCGTRGGGGTGCGEWCNGWCGV